VMSQTVLESGLPLYCNNLHETEPYLRDPLVQAARLRTYLGAPLRDSTGRIRGTLSLGDAESRAFDSLDVELITVAGLHVAARLRAEEQEEAKRELEDHLRQVQKMEAVGMLAGGIAHDFNNILSGILGFASFLLAKVDKNSDIYGNLQLIEQSAVRASELTRQLLAFARRKHFAKEPVNLNDVIKGVLSILQRSLAKNIVIRPELAEDLPTMLGDAGQLNQVVMNLCLNAADAMAERGGTLRIKTAHRLLTSRERSVLLDAGAGEYVCVTVSDTGKGMNPDVQAHIFDPFFTTKADLGGTGLGLSIVYGIVTNHDGDITVESAEDKGSVFKLYFPVHRGDVRKEESPTALKLRGTETILVVDDEMIVRQMVTAVLKDYGYKVVAVSSGAEAVTMIEELRGRIHLVLLDIVMPGMDGEATYVAIRQIDREVPVLLSSGFAQEERSARLIADGAKGIIHKPYKSEALLSQIREILDSHVWSST
jgi:two-component system cell cycle sensor histidine kinase/response regulator CckA